MPYHESEERILNAVLSGARRGALLHSANPDACEQESLLFFDASEHVVAHSVAEVLPAIGRLEGAIAKGKYVAGYMSYEAGYALEKCFSSFCPHRGAAFPLLNFGVYAKPLVFKNLDLQSRVVRKFPSFWLHSPAYSNSKQTYKEDFATIKEFIAAGDVYQINHCFQLNGSFAGNAGALFCALLERQKVSYAAYLNMGPQQVLSLSPELFFDITGRTLTMRPMKGTLIRNHRDSRAEKSALRRFSRSRKNKAENLMIVDLIRNDSSRISYPHSVRVPQLYTVETYDTVYQMTSTITSSLRKGARLREVFSALFPCGSVTGAPKIRAMEIIHEQECDRGPYTGAIGYVGPSMKRAAFNIPIRTVCIDQRKRSFSLGIGSGVVADSTCRSEYQECLGKARFLTGLLTRYALIETLLYVPGKGYALKKRHLARMARSARFFRIPFSVDEMNAALNRYRSRMTRAAKYRVRVLLDVQGALTITHNAIRNITRQRPARVCISTVVMDSSNVFLRHKTTNRRIYTEEYTRAQKKGYYDALFFNEKGQLTEAAISNVFVKKDGIYYTSRVRDGVLPGVYREQLLSKDPQKYQERALRKVDLENADAVYVCNSVRGMQRVSVDFSSGGALS